MGSSGRRSRSPLAWLQPRRSRAAALLLVAALVGCSGTTSGPVGPGPGIDAGQAAAGPARLSECRPLQAGAVRGRLPAYLPDGVALEPLPVSDAVCDGLWAPRTAAALVPQGVAVRGGTAWLTGYDEGEPGSLWCRVVRLDLRTGDLLAERRRVSGRVGAGPEVGCRHGGGVALDRHGLWLTESARLWLMDPRSLEVLRAWRLADPVQGSFGLLDDRGRIGLGRFRPSRVHPGRAALDWFDLDTVLAPGVVELGSRDAVATKKVPSHAQGAVWARMGGRTGVWFARSTTRCGVLEGPGGVRRAFLPGAEGMARAGAAGLWAVSESAARSFWRLGGRPVVATLSRLDTGRLRAWPEPTCDPGD